MFNAHYEQERNKLIPDAERFANQTIGKTPKGNRDEWTIKWNKAFLGKMDQLAKETGLCK